MKANELRIGNLVINDGCLSEVIGIFEDQIKLRTKQKNEISAHLDLIKPILLTDNWMLHLGLTFSPGVL